MADDREAYVARWLSVLDELSHYEVLGVSREVDAQDLQQAFHRFSQAFHPDSHRGVHDELRAGFSTIFRRGAEAYRVLKDRRSRSDYDLWLATHTAPLGSSERHQTLADLCQTKGGQLYARQAERAISEGKPRDALPILRNALAVEGDNPLLAERLDALQQVVLLSEPPPPLDPEDP